MDKKFRRIYYITFIIVFLIAAPIIVLYSLGYRYNFSKNKIYKIGILVVDSSPRSASVYIDNQYIKKTPAVITNLIPREYQIEVKKDGYFPWKKKLTIYSKTTTFADQIYLFKNKEKPNLIVQNKILDYQISNDEKKLVYTILNGNKNEIWLYNLERSMTIGLIYEAAKEADFSDWLWTGNNQKLLFRQNLNGIIDFIVINLTGQTQAENLGKITPLKFDKMVWSSNNENILFGLSNGLLYQIDLVSQKTSPVISEAIEDFYILGSKIYFLKKDNNQTALSQMDINLKKAEIIKELDGEDYVFSRSNLQFLVLKNIRNNQITFIALQPNLSLPNLDVTVNDFQLSENMKELLLWNDFEIWFYDFENNEKTLIERGSEKINRAVWFENYEYLFYNLTDSINIGELDGRDKRNDYQLIKTDGEITLMNLLSIKDLVYFQIENDKELKDGVYSLSVR